MPDNPFSQIYRADLGLLTDLYQLTMAKGYWRSGLYQRRAVFNLFFRRAPFGHPYAITAGLEAAIAWLQQFRFSVHDIQYLGSLRGADGCALFDEPFLNHLQRMAFACDIDAMPEGTAAFAHQPILRVEGPLLQVQLLETALLNIINFNTLIATKSSRIVAAAQGDPVLEFGLRRAQGIDGGISASRAAYIGGCYGTSNVLAGRLFGIPVKGTHAHSWVMSFEHEIDAFRAYAAAMPNNCIFLVDTYDTLTGVRNAITVGRELRQAGHDLLGIRLDSGDLAGLSRQARQLLDEAGFEHSVIVASNDLDEYAIRDLKAAQAPISVWGVGTRLVTAYDQAALGGVFKLAAIADEQGAWAYRIKRSEQAIKVSNPGIQQVYRFSDEAGRPIGDQIADAHSAENTDAVHRFDTGKLHIFGTENKEALLKPIFRAGRLVYEAPPLKAVRTHAAAQCACFSHLGSAEEYPNGLSPMLQSIKARLLEPQK